jgi:transposase
MDRGIAVFSINPKQLDRFRDRFSRPGPRTTGATALVLASSLRTDRHCFRRVEAMDPLVVELREWSRMAEELKQERNRLTNRVRQQFWRYYPQFLDLADDPGADWVLALWAEAPTPARVAHLTETKIASTLAAHRIRRITAAGALAILKRPALTVAPGTAEAAQAHIATVAERLRLVNRQIKDVTRRIDALVGQLAGSESQPGQGAEQHDVTILRSLPGVGVIVVATLLAEAPQAIQQRDYHALRTLTGAAPVTKRSGKSCHVEMRQACSHRLRTAVYHWARVAMQHDPASRGRYAANAWIRAGALSLLKPTLRRRRIQRSPTKSSDNELDHGWEVPPARLAIRCTNPPMPHRHHQVGRAARQARISANRETYSAPFQTSSGAGTGAPRLSDRQLRIGRPITFNSTRWGFALDQYWRLAAAVERKHREGGCDAKLR